ncbi:MAG: hypothetical protein Q8R13_00005 [bacterium]|nr:hypothetical protein [bacterium]
MADIFVFYKEGTPSEIRFAFRYVLRTIAAGNLSSADPDGDLDPEGFSLHISPFGEFDIPAHDHDIEITIEVDDFPLRRETLDQSRHAIAMAVAGVLPERITFDVLVRLLPPPAPMRRNGGCCRYRVRPFEFLCVRRCPAQRRTVLFAPGRLTMGKPSR